VVMSDADLFTKSCLEASLFPKNIVRHSTPQHHLDAYVSRLDRESSRLFCDDGRATLDILEYDDEVKGTIHVEKE
jgi:hypothetical protein